MRTLATTALAVVALVFASDAAACTCLAAPVRQRLDSADAAFIGRLTGTRADPEPGPIKNLGREIVYVFTVDSVVKGELGRRVEVLSPASGAACGFELRPEEAQGILLRRDGESWTGGLCGQVAIGELIAAAEATDERLVNWGGVVVGAGVLVAGAVLVLRRLRRRRQSLLR